jgi:polysaccharide biosynthesis protein PslH
MMGREPRILFVAPTIPYPLDGGWNQRMFYTMKNLSAMGPVSFASYAPRGARQSEPDFGPVKDLCASVHILDEPESRWPLPARSTRDLLDRFVFTRRPYGIEEFPGGPLADLVAQLAPGVDLIWVVRLYLAEWLPRDRDKMVVDLDDLEHVKQRRYLAGRRSGLWQLAVRLDNQRTRRLERSAPARYGKVVLASDSDRRVFPRRLAKRVFTVPNGVARELLSSGPTESRPQSIVFVGNMNYQPNVDAAFWFAREIFPHILEAAPGATLSLVGRDDRGHLRALHDGRAINVTGRVPDVAPFVSGATVSVAPIRVAGGTRIKILESLALGTPVVATTIGAEGLGLVPDQHLKIGDTPRAFAESVIALLKDPERRRAMAAAGRVVVAERYTWEVIGQRLREDVAGWLIQRADGLQVAEGLRGRFHA